MRDRKILTLKCHFDMTAAETVHRLGIPETLEVGDRCSSERAFTVATVRATYVVTEDDLKLVEEHKPGRRRR